MKIPAREAVAALHGTAVGTLPETLQCTIDTRSIRAGETYVVLRGERFDGHAFLADAQRAGAVAAIVERADALPDGLPGIVVAEAHTALLALASLAREHFCGAVVGITGSAGKTTTKEFLLHILRGVTTQPIIGSPANENNEIGVSKLLLNLASEAAAVVEMGARNFGDIAVLAALARPHVGIVTNIGEAHIEIFGSHERLAETKWQIFALGARAVLHLADAPSRARAATLSAAPYYFGLASELDAASTPARYTGIVTIGDASIFVTTENGMRTEYACDTDVPGAHNRRNLAAACAGALAIGFSAEAIARAISGVRQPSGRYERRAGADGITVIHDAYNASPAGSLASIRAFAQEPGQRRIVVFGSMAELGDRAVSAHEEVGAALAEAAPDAVFLGGQFASDVEHGATSAGFAQTRIFHYRTNAELIENLRPFIRRGDTILVKGSRMYRLEEIVDALTADDSNTANS